MENGLTLCAPGLGLGCFACCPPIRPPGYDHARYESSLRRLFVENTAQARAGAPARPMLGFWCHGLGFLDGGGQRVGCLWHPARNNGRDLRGPTGYQEKCARESCLQARAFAELTPATAAALIGLCQGMGSFAFSSPTQNLLLRLLAFGPEVATATAALTPAALADLAALPWLDALAPTDGWLLARLIEARGPAALTAPEAVARLSDLARRLAQALGPRPPLAAGQPLRQQADRWQARFWTALSGRARARPDELARWQAALAALL